MIEKFLQFFRFPNKIEKKRKFKKKKLLKFQVFIHKHFNPNFFVNFLTNASKTHLLRHEFSYQTFENSRPHL